MKPSRRLMQVLTVVPVAVAVFAGVAFASHSWGNYHWARKSNPFTLKLGDNVTSAWDSYLRGASTDWSKSSVLDTTVVAGTVSNLRRCAPTSGRVEVCNYRYGNNGWLGVAGISVSGGHITQGYVKLNDTYYNTATYNTPAWRASVTCQEIGHTLGLGHNDEDFNTTNGTCMDYSNNPTQNQHPDAHDYAQLEAIYSHLDGTTTVGASIANAAPPAMRNLVLESVDEWGPVASVSRDGHQTAHVQDFGNGHRVITFVTWTFDVRGNRPH